MTGVAIPELDRRGVSTCAKPGPELNLITMLGHRTGRATQKLWESIRAATCYSVSALSPGKSLSSLCDGPCPCLPEPEPPKPKAEKSVCAAFNPDSIRQIRTCAVRVATCRLCQLERTAAVIHGLAHASPGPDTSSALLQSPELSIREAGVGGACTDKELRNLASRLKDWFGALHEDANRVIKPTSSDTAQGRFDTSILPICKDSLGWMFNKLDMNYDLLLDHSEINAIYLDKYEPCIKPLFNSCDSFKDGKLSNNEWCYCFQKPGGAFIPRCNEEGYYKATQCHGSTGQCWCVDKYGNELAGSRKQGTVSCEEEQETSGDFGSGGSVVLLDDLEDERELGPKDREGKLRVHTRAVREDDEDEDDDKEDETLHMPFNGASGNQLRPGKIAEFGPLCSLTCVRLCSCAASRVSVSAAVQPHLLLLTALDTVISPSPGMWRPVGPYYDRAVRREKARGVEEMEGERREGG
ncbi:hypothetical protein A6R68_03096, partial [Neotoma lepida]